MRLTRRLTAGLLLIYCYRNASAPRVAAVRPICVGGVGGDGGGDALFIVTSPSCAVQDNKTQLLLSMSLSRGREYALTACLASSCGHDGETLVHILKRILYFYYD